MPGIAALRNHRPNVMEGVEVQAGDQVSVVGNVGGHGNPSPQPRADAEVAGI